MEVHAKLRILATQSKIKKGHRSDRWPLVKFCYLPGGAGGMLEFQISRYIFHSPFSSFHVEMYLPLSNDDLSLPNNSYVPTAKTFSSLPHTSVDLTTIPP